MGESEISFGDRIFLYGQFLSYIYDYDEPIYNSVVGYMTVGGYLVTPIKTDKDGASIPGFVVEIPYNHSLAPAAPFDHMEMVDITDKLAHTLPLPSGTKVWLPTTVLP